MNSTPGHDGPDDAAASSRTGSYSSGRLVVGIVGRTWLWFVAGCLLVTMLPLLLGWRPYVVRSGSMEPRISVGDIVLAAPAQDASALLGRVTVFTDPGQPERTKVHRVVAIEDDGTLRTQGDANPTPDSLTVPMDQVRGMARLLVSYAGLPFVWLQTQQWALLGGFLVTLLLAGLAVSRDQEDDEDDDDRDDVPTSGPGDLRHLPSRASGAAQIAASTPLDPGLRRLAVSPWLRRTGYVAALASALALPSAGASFAATTRTPGNAWTAGSWSNAYTSLVQGLSPWLYWKLDDSGTGSVVADSSTNNRPGQYVVDGSATYVTKGATGALVNNAPNVAVTLTNASSCVATSSTVAPSGTAAPSQFTAVVWFRTTSNLGGKLLGFESPRTGVLAYTSGGRYDRHLYLDANGRIWFGAANGTTLSAISSTDNVNNGQWHMAAGVMTSAGMRLYVDGALVSSNTFSSASSYSGWWRAGCGNLSGWGGLWDGGGSPSGSFNQARNFPFAGSLDEVSVWNSPLTAAQITSMWNAR